MRREGRRGFEPGRSQVAQDGRLATARNGTRVPLGQGFGAQAKAGNLRFSYAVYSLAHV